MYHLYGFDEIIRNVYKISQSLPGEKKIETTDELRKYYLEFLSKQQSHAPVNWDDDLFISDNKIEDKLAESYSASTLNDLNQENIIGDSYSLDVKHQKIQFAKDALVALMSLDEKLDVVFNLVIHSIFIKGYKKSPNLKGSYGGSSSAAIGTIWISADENVTELDLMELFVHELTHHLIFIDELNYPQFNYSEIVKKENFAFSAILNKSRPLDKVIHSIVVATELILWRQKFSMESGKRTIHPSTDKMQNDIILACDSVFKIKNIEHIIYPRSIEMMDRCMIQCKTLTV